MWHFLNPQNNNFLKRIMAKLKCQKTQHECLRILCFTYLRLGFGTISTQTWKEKLLIVKSMPLCKLYFFHCMLKWGWQFFVHCVIFCFSWRRAILPIGTLTKLSCLNLLKTRKIMSHNVIFHSPLGGNFCDFSANIHLPWQVHVSPSWAFDQGGWIICGHTCFEHPYPE